MRYETNKAVPPSIEEQQAFANTVLADIAKDRQEQTLNTKEIDTSPGLFTALIPGLFDSADFNHIVALKESIERLPDMEVEVIDIFQLPRTTHFERTDDEPDVYRCDFTPGEYMRAIKRALDKRPNKRKFVGGISYGGWLASLLTAFDAGDQIEGLVAIQPTSYYTGRSYDPAQAIREYREARLKRSMKKQAAPSEPRAAKLSYTPNPELFRQADPNDPTSRQYNVQVSEHSILSHVTPWKFINDDDEPWVDVVLENLAGSNVLELVEARSLWVAATEDTFAPPQNVEKMYNQVNSAGKDPGFKKLVLLDMDHDYRMNPALIDAMNYEVTSCLAKWIKSPHRLPSSNI